MKIFFIAFVLLSSNFLYAQQYEEVFRKNIFGNISAIDWVDLNSDGSLDVVLLMEDKLQIFENRNGQINAVPIEYQLLTESLIDFADIDNDNLIDLIISSENSTTHLWYNQGNFKFIKTQLSSALFSQPFTADLDNNGFKEILLQAEDESGNTENHLWLNRKDSLQVISDSIDLQADTKILIDFNNDGRIDILTSQDTVTAIYLNESSINFDSVVYLVDSFIKNPVAADLNADGWLDVAGFCKFEDSWNLLVFYNSFKSNLSKIDTLQEIANPHELFAADVSYDGFLDLLIIQEDTGNYNTYVIENQKDSSFASKEFLMTGRVALGDYDTDNDLDLAVISDDYLVVYRCNQINNLQPTPPEELFALNDGENVTINWNAGNDDTTPSQSLTYNILMYSDLPDLSTTFEANNNSLSIVKFGDQSLNNSWKINKLEERRYFFDVISIDNSYIPSFFEGPDCNDDGCICNTGRCFTFVVDHDNQQYVCFGDTINLDIASEQETIWHSQNDGELGSENPLIYIARSDDILYTNFINEQGCTETFSLPIKLKSAPNLNRMYDTTLCKNEEISISSIHDASLIRWFSKQSETWSTNDRYIATVTDTLIMEMQDISGCFYYDTINVNISPNPEVKTSDHQTINSGQQIQISASGGIKYQWSPAEGLNNAFIANPLASPSGTTNYRVQVTNEYGCTAYGSVEVSVNQLVFVPNLFSPNGDGKNDTFKIYGSQIQEINLKVLDRAGNVVFETNNPQIALSQGWNGTFNNRELPPGNYYWSVEGSFIDGGSIITENNNSGIITLIR